MANKAILSEPTRLYVTELTETKMVLVAKFNGICWQLIFKPRDGAPVAEDPLFGVTSKTWVYDNESAGYMGCGGSLGNPTEAAAAASATPPSGGAAAPTRRTPTA